MSTTPPEQPGTPPPASTPPPSTPPASGPSTGGYGGLGHATGAILPIPGNAELVVYFVAVIFLIIIWAASSLVNASQFVTLFTFLTIGYVLSRGIAKASRVLEQ